MFYLLRQPLPEGWEWVQGRPTRKQKTNRPPTIWPEFWKALSSKQKERALQQWALEKPKLEAAQAVRGFKCVPEDDEEYLSILNAARARLAQGEPPAMLCTPYACYSAGGDPCKNASGATSKKAGGDPCSGARGAKTTRIQSRIKIKRPQKGTRVSSKWHWCIYRSPSTKP